MFVLIKDDLSIGSNNSCNCMVPEDENDDSSSPRNKADLNN
jgi:hypothetical protein